MSFPEQCEDVTAWSVQHGIGKLATLESLRRVPDSGGVSITFGQPAGDIGLIALDNPLTDSIL